MNSIADDGVLRGQWQHQVAREVTEHLTWLMGAARKVAPRGIEPEDLLSEAITRLLTIGADSPPHIGNVRTYLATVMRNSAIDHLRSPLARVETQDVSFFTRFPYEYEFESAGVRSADLHQEFAVVRQAFAELHEEEQTLLDQVLIQGRKTSEVSKELGYTPANGSLRVFRARSALKRLVLVQHLRRGTSECAENASKIAGEVHTDLARHSPKARGLHHVRSCDRCQHNWKRFAHMSQA